MELNNKLSQKIIIFISAVIGIEACLVMAGWIFGIDSLTRILPGGINMKFPTAIVFFFSAAALYFIFRIEKDNNEAALVFLPGAILFIFLMMGVILIAGITGTSSGIENLFIISQNSINGSGSGLPSVITMINFILFGIVCINYLFGGARQRVSGFSGLFIVAVSLLSVIGYIFSLPALYFGIYGWTPIALNTALLFILLGCGLIIVGKIEHAI